MLLGEQYVGKTSIIRRLCKGTFLEKRKETEEYDWTNLYKTISIDNKEVLEQITLIDTLGLEKFNSIGAYYIKQCHGFMFVYDISDLEGLNSIKKWKKLIDDNSSEDKPILLVGNKSDLPRKISRENAMELARNNKFLFGLESTCKDLNNINIENNMLFLIKRITQNVLLKKEKDIGISRPILSLEKKEKNKCC